MLYFKGGGGGGGGIWMILVDYNVKLHYLSYEEQCD